MAKIVLLAIGLFLFGLGAALIGIGSERWQGRGLSHKEAQQVMFELFLCLIGIAAATVGAYQ